MSGKLGEEVLKLDEDERVKRALLVAFEDVVFDEKDFLNRGFAEEVSIHAVISYVLYHIFKSFPEVASDDYRVKVECNNCRALETRSTARGFAKLKVIRAKSRAEMDRLLVAPDALLANFTGLEDLKSLCEPGPAREYFESLHGLHRYEERDPRRYVYCVFRHYADLLHARGISTGSVSARPSFVRLLDARAGISQADLPLEFREFVDNIGTKVCKVECSPTVRNNGVSYDDNPEGLPCVSLARATVARTFSKWMDDGTSFGTVYPEFLLRASASPFVMIYGIVDRIVSSVEDLERLEATGCDVVWLRLHPELAGIHAKYQAHPFTTESEQLVERYSWFLQTSVRQLFQNVRTQNFIELLFFNLKLNLRTLEPFATYCSGRNFSRRTEDDQRYFLGTMQCVIKAFHVAFVIKPKVTKVATRASRNPFQNKSIRVSDD